MLLPWVGMWKGLWLMGAVYAGLVLVLWQPSDGWAARLARFAALAGGVILLAGQPGLAPTRLNSGETLLAFREGPSAHVAAIQRGDAKFIRVNNFYTLGGSGALVTGPARDRLYADLLDALPPEDDPYLMLLSEAQRALPRAGAIYVEWRGVRARDDLRAGRLWQDFVALTPPHARNPDSPAGQVARGGMAFGDTSAAD